MKKKMKKHSFLTTLIPWHSGREAEGLTWCSQWRLLHLSPWLVMPRPTKERSPRWRLAIWYRGIYQRKTHPCTCIKLQWASRACSMRIEQNWSNESKEQSLPNDMSLLSDLGMTIGLDSTLEKSQVLSRDGAQNGCSRSRKWHLLLLLCC